MVYVYVCKRFKVTMEMVSGKDSEWILNLVKFYLKHRRKEMQKLERAEVNPKRRTTTCSYDSSSDVFKINLVYKDQKGVDQELKWIIKVRFSVKQILCDILNWPGSGYDPQEKTGVGYNRQEKPDQYPDPTLENNQDLDPDPT